LAAKAPDNAYWIVLDFLGFSRLNLDLSMGYADFRGQNFLEPFSPCVRADGAGVCGRGHMEGRAAA
jgi:hypothetical protein